MQTADMLDLDVPALRGGKPIIVESEPDWYVKQVMEDFVVRAERIRGGGVDPSVDNFLKITHEARLLGTDARLIDKDAPNNPDGKLNKVAENVWKEYERGNADGHIGCQLIFSDIGTPGPDKDFTIYDYLKETLIQYRRVNNMSIRKVVAGLLITAGIAIMAVPFFWRATGEKQTEQLISEFEQTLEDDYDEETDVEEEQTSISKEDEAILKEGGVIGIIEIPGLDIRYPVMEGTTSKVLNAGIGHIEETAGIGESGNCVLCGHNGSRYGTFFTPLSQISIGDEVMITDKNGLKHIYEVTETEVVNPYDNSIKTQGTEKELTLFTCSQKGTMRFVVRCIYKEAVMDE